MSRIDKIKTQYNDAVLDKIKEQGYSTIEDEIWDIIQSADPAMNKKNTRWIVETFLNNGFLWEDISHGKESKVYETLYNFDKYKNNLDIEQRTLIQYKTLGKMWFSIKDYIGLKSHKEEKKEEQEKIYEETKFFINENGFKILSPLTEEAAKWWGKGTRWCTSADNNNQFENYNNDGPLIIVITPEGKKYQGWMSSNEESKNIQFMNEYDDTIEEYEIEEDWKFLKHLSYYLRSIHYIPFDKIDKRTKLEYCINNGENLLTLLQNNDRDVDNEFIKKVITENQNLLENIIENEVIPVDDDFISFAIKLHPSHALEFYDIDLELFDFEINDFILEELKKNYSIEQYFPYLKMNMITEELCQEAFEKNKKLINYFPQSFITQNMINEAYKEHFTETLKKIKPEQVTKDILMFALENNRDLLNLQKESFYSKIPETIFDDELNEALSFNIIGFNFIKNKTSQHFLNYVSSNGDHLYNLSLKHKEEINKDIVIEALKTGKECLTFVPENLKTDDIIELAVLKNPNNIFSIKPEKRNQEMYEHLIMFDPWKIVQIPQEQQTENMWRFACNYNPVFLEKLPEHLKTTNFLLSLKNKNEHILFNLKKTNIPLSEEVIIHFIKGNGMEIRHLNEKEKNNNIIKEAVKQNIKSAIFIPDNKISDNKFSNDKMLTIVLSLLKEDPKNFILIPEKYQTKEIFESIEKDWKHCSFFEETKFSIWLREDEKDCFPMNEELYFEFEDCIRKAESLFSDTKKYYYSPKN